MVAVEPLSSGRKPQAFYTTVIDATAEQVLSGYARRWAVEVTVPTAMLLYSLIMAGFARDAHRHLAFPNRPWYCQKRRASVADMLTMLRRECLRETFLQTPAWDPGSAKLLRPLVDFCSRAA